MRNSIFPKREPGSNSWLLSFSWEQREFENSFSLLQNNTLSRSELSESPGVAANIHYGDVLIKFGEYLDIEDETFPWIKKQTDADKFKMSFLQDGDIVFADTAEDETAGKCCEIRNCGSTVIISGLHTIPCRPESKFALGYLGYYLNSTAFHEQLIPLMQGTKVVSISKTALKSTNIQYPSDDKEQQKIGQLFQALDRLITLHQRECFFSRIRKKLKITSQKTNAWEQRDFENSFSLLQNNTLSRSELSDSPGVAANIHYGDVLIKFGEYLDIVEETFPWIKKQTDADKFRMSFLQDGDIIFADTAEDETAGKCCEIRNCGSTVIISGLHTIPCRPESEFAPGYLGYYLNSTVFHEQLIPLMQGTKVVSISKTALKSTNIQYPSDDKEQQKIGQFFRGLDCLITLHQRERLFLILEEILC